MHKLPKLNFDYGDLEPYINGEIMELHHDKHHAGYVSKLNASLESYKELADKSIEELLSDLSVIPDEIRASVIGNGGGHFNHSFFWETMSKDGGGEPEGRLAKELVSKYGSFEEFKNTFSSAAASVLGSGWAWLIDDMTIITSSNQDSPISIGKKPILTIDVWEHAYYLQYKNVRPDYISNWWNVIDWGKVEEKLVS